MRYSKFHSSFGWSKVVGLLTAVVMLAGTGCLVTQKKFDALQIRVVELEQKAARLQTDLETLSTRIENLKNLSQKEQEAIRKRLAELAADLSDLRRSIAQVQGSQEVIDFKLKEVGNRVKGLKGLVEDRFGLDSSDVPENLPEDPKAMYDLAQSAYNSGLTRKARAIFTEVAKRYPEHELADDSLFMVGEALFAEGRFTESIDAYRKVYEEFQTGDKYREAVLRIGLAYVRSNRCKKALKIYKFAADTFRKTEEGEAAKKEVKALKKICQ